VATSINVNGFLYADALTTSLTKLFSGAGDVAAGAVILNPNSPFYDILREDLAREEAASPLFLRDAITLELNSRHFVERVGATNENGQELVDWLSKRPEVEAIWHPSNCCRENYDQVRRASGGYGALFSLKLKADQSAIERFYDALEISKGPSLGTDFSLVCPYTLLAHYNELDWAAERGAPSDLIRVWVGLEDPEDLIGRCERAFKAMKNLK